MTAAIPYPQIGNWSRFVDPMVKRINLNVITGLTTTFTPENAQILADLLATMADRIDNPPVTTITVDELLAGKLPPSFFNTGKT